MYSIHVYRILVLKLEQVGARKCIQTTKLQTETKGNEGKTTKMNRWIQRPSTIDTAVPGEDALAQRVARMEGELEGVKLSVSGLMDKIAERVVMELANRGAMFVVKSTDKEIATAIASALREEEEAMEAAVPRLAGKPEASVVSSQASDMEIDCDNEVSDDSSRAEEGSSHEVDAIMDEDEDKISSEPVEMPSDPTVNDQAAPSTLPTQPKQDGTNCIEASDPHCAPASPQDEPQTSQESSEGSDTSNMKQEPDLTLSDFDKIATSTTPPRVVPCRPPPLPPQRQETVSKTPRMMQTSANMKVNVVEMPGQPGPLPADFEVHTKDSLQVAWVKWCCGDAELGIPPYRLINSKQIANRAVIPRLSDLRCAMTPIESIAKAEGLWHDHLSAAEAGAVFVAIQDQLPLGDQDSQRKRKKDVAWPTALNRFRREKKRKQEMQQGK